MEEKKNILTNKKMQNIQRIVFFGALFSAIFVFLFSLLFMSPFSDIYQIDGQFLFSRMINFGLKEIENLPDKGNVSAYIYSLSTGKKIGMNLAYFTDFTKTELQAFNHWLFALGFFGLLASLIPFVYASQKRKIYYKTNFIVNPIVGVFNMYIGIHMLIQLIMNQNLVWGQNYQIINAYQTYINDNKATTIINYYKPSDSNWIFILGYVICILVLFFALSSIILTYKKYHSQKNGPEVDLSKVIIHE